MIPTRIGTRKSKLAMIQAQLVQGVLERHDPAQVAELVQITTTGDQKNTQRFVDMDEKALFTKELDEALDKGEIDCAVHSLKDIPSSFTDKVTLAAVFSGEEFRDAFVSNQFLDFKSMKPGSVVGTSSTRRVALIKSKYPELKIKTIRGNVDTRLAKLDSGEFDAIVLSAAGLHRLSLQDRVRSYLDPEWFTPSIGQGFIGVCCRANDTQMIERLRELQSAEDFQAVTGLRIFMKELQGGCSVPLGAYHTLKGAQLVYRSFLAHPNGQPSMRAEQIGRLEDYESLAHNLVLEMKALGAKELLESL